MILSNLSIAETYEKDPFVIEYPEHECYFCRRTKDDLLDLASLMEADIEKRISSQKDNIQGRLNKIKTKYQPIIDQLHENQYLNLKIETLKTDPAQFAELIPNLQKIIEYSQYDSDTVSIVVKDLKKMLEEISSPEFRGNNMFPEIKDAYDNIQWLEEKKQEISKSLVLHSKYVRIGHNPSNRFRFTSGSKNVVKVQICGICSGIFEEASEAAYSILDDSYDDD